MITVSSKSAYHNCLAIYKNFKNKLKIYGEEEANLYMNEYQLSKFVNMRHYINDKYYVLLYLVNIDSECVIMKRKLKNY